MSIKNQILIASKIKSIDPNFIPSIQVDSRAAPDERELEFMAEVVIAVNNLKNVRNVNKIFFNRQVKSYKQYGVYDQYVRSYRDGSIELYVNLHRHDLNVERTVSTITNVKNQEFIRTRQSYENVNFVKAEVKEVVKEVKEIEMNDEKITIQKSVFGYDGVTVGGDDGESWINFPPAKTEDDEEEVSMNVTVKEEITVNNEIAVNVTETEDELDRAIAEFNNAIESAETESVNEIVDHFASAFIERIKESEHFIEKVDFQKAATVVGKQCREYAPYLHFADDAVHELLVAKVKYDHKFSEASKFESFDNHNVRQVGAYGVCYIDREGDSCYGVPERFKPKSDAAFYAEAKYEKLFKSAFDDGVRFEFVGVEPSSHMVKIGEKFFVEHRALMCSFMTDEEILAEKPKDDESSDEEYIEMIREGESDRTDRYVVMIRKINL